ncbi:MAG: oligopeptide transporter, OPT family, partial [Planctomycetaceae bacterium]|nr:oligopeptide transporter, OPT family [Planctomycetaceae bacterium]
MSVEESVVSPQSDEPRAEITPRVIVLGLLLSVIMGAANVYVGLKAGMTVSASIPAAVMAMMFFRLLFRNSTIREANQVQTCASAGESLAAGIIFTMPAMVLIGYWTSFDYWTITIIAFTGGLMGILFMIPMRRVFVVDNDELAYPEGVACAAVLKAGENAEEDSGAGKSLILGGLLGTAFKLMGGFLGLIAGSLETARVVGTRIFYIGGDLSPMLVAVGFIVRLNVAVLIFLGGALSWLIGIPIIGGASAEESAVDQAYSIWSSQVRYVGVGAMVLGGFASLYNVRAGLIAAVRELWSGMTGNQQPADASQRDIPSRVILLLAALCVFLLAGVNYSFTKGVSITA